MQLTRVFRQDWVLGLKDCLSGIFEFLPELKIREAIYCLQYLVNRVCQIEQIPTLVICYYKIAFKLFLKHNLPTFYLDEAL